MFINIFKCVGHLLPPCCSVVFALNFSSPALKECVCWAFPAHCTHVTLGADASMRNEGRLHLLILGRHAASQKPNLTSFQNDCRLVSVAPQTRYHFFILSLFLTLIFFILIVCCLPSSFYSVLRPIKMTKKKC